MTEFDIEFSTSNLFTFFLILILSVGISMYWYKNEELLTTLPKKAVLIALRALALFFVLILFLEPILSFKKNTRVPIPFSVLLDNSASMTIKDKGTERASELKRVLTQYSSEINQLGELNLFSFGNKLNKVNHIDSLRFSEHETDVANALETANLIAEKKRSSAVLLFSDGQYTVGSQPSYVAASSNVPIHTFLVGDTLFHKDIILQRVISPKSVIQGLSIPFSASIYQNKFEGKQVEVVLKQKNDILEKRSVILQNRETLIDFEIKSSDEGTLRFDLSVTPVEDEFSQKNNYYSFFVDVIRNKKKVLVISGFPDPEISAIKNTLAINSNIEATFFTQKSPSTFFEGTLTKETVASTDACLLIGFPASGAASNFVEAILNMLDVEDVSTLSLFTYRSNSAQIKKLEPLLPVTIENQNPQLYENLVFADVYPSTQSSPIFKTFQSSIPSVLKASPPMSYYDYAFKLKPNATPLLKLVINNLSTDKIIYATLKQARSKHAAMLGIQFWRYYLSPELNTKSFYQSLVLGTIEWLTIKDDLEPLRVESSSKVFNILSSVSFSATVQDEFFAPVSNAIINISVQNTSTKSVFQTTFQNSKQLGLYAAYFEALPEGDYVFTTTGTLNEKPLNIVKGTFSVVEIGKEFINTEANIHAMKSIAEKSGGKFYFLNDFGAFIKQDKILGFEPIIKTTQETFSFSDAAIILSIIILLLSSEWVLRKVFGLA